MKRIGIIATDLHKGRFRGPEQYIFQMIHHLKRVSGVEVVPIVFDRPLACFSGPQCVIPGGFSPTAVRSARRRLAKEGFDVIQCNRIAPTQLIRLPKEPKRVLVLHGDLAFVLPQYAAWKGRMRFRCIVPRYIRRFDAYIAVSQSVRRSYIEKYHLPQERVHVIYEGATTVTPHKPQNISWQEAKPFFLHVSNFAKKKHPQMLFTAFSRVAQRHPDVQLVICGNGWSDNRAVQHILKQIPASIQSRIHMAGSLDENALAWCYTHAVALFHPTLHETFGLTLAEAMAYGLPVVSSRVYSVPEVVGDAGILCAPHDTQGFVQALLRVLENSALRETYAEQAQERAKQFTWKRTAEQTAAWYQDL